VIVVVNMMSRLCFLGHDVEVLGDRHDLNSISWILMLKFLFVVLFCLHMMNDMSS
jgi:hypothetical protein